MAHQEPTFDLHQLTHEVVSATQEVVTVPFRLRTYRLIRKILIGFILVSIANVLFSYFFLTPKMLRINRDNQELVVRYRILQDRKMCIRDRSYTVMPPASVHPETEGKGSLRPHW